MTNKTTLYVLALGLASGGLATTASAAPGATKLDQSITIPSTGIRTLGARSATMQDGRAIVIARLTNDPLKADSAAIEAEQQAFLARCLQVPNTTLIARTRHVLNAVFLAVDSAHVADIAADPAVSRISPVGNYQVDLAETVPYVGASAVQAAGVDGTGVRVAVLDSGVDYLHADLGGSGSVAEYEANDRNIVEPGTFPTQKVVGGFDFVGEVWPTGDLEPDPDPLAAPGVGDHGNHVADIIGGVNGVAPGTEIYAVKVCSAISSSCSGVALIQGMEFSADPNGDGSTSDHVDIINMSLGSNFGQPFDDDLAQAVENATKLGILTVASAGNGGDRPYVNGTPAAAASAISVAQTSVPSAVQDRMEVTAPASDAGLYTAVRQTWSGALTSVISGPVQYGANDGTNLNGCEAFPAGSLAGKIVMVDRGACFFSLKIQNIEAAGGILGIIGLIAPGAPFAGGFGDGTPPVIPGFMINQADADILRTGAAEISFDPANGISLAGSMVGSSSRGPRNFDNGIKPEIGAPGASISAAGGTGVERTPFGGTSGAAPMVAGAAALLKESRPWAAPWLIKALLLNSANPDVAIDFNGVPAEVSRIGAGELAVNKAFFSKVKVVSGLDATLSMGYRAIARETTKIRRRLTIVNDMQKRRTFDISSSFRNADDAASNAIAISHPSSVTVGPGGSKTFTVTFEINGANLPTSSMNSGSVGNDPAALTATEYDGYITVEDEDDDVNVPWHIVPRKSADVRGRKTFRIKDGTAEIDLTNRGVGPANNDAYTLVAISNNIPSGPAGGQAPTPDLKAVGVRTTPVPAGFCSGDESFLLEVAFQSWEPQTNLLPVIFAATLDLDGDGTDDIELVNLDFGTFTGGGLDGRSLSVATDLAAGTDSAFFFTTHATNTTNTVITFCAEQLGLTPEDLGSEITATFSANDFYFGGPGDELEPVTFTLGGGLSATVDDIEAGGTGTMTVTDNGGTGGTGILLFTNGDRGAGNRGGATPATEGQIFAPPGAKRPF